MTKVTSKKSNNLWLGALGLGVLAAVLVVGTTRVEADTETNASSRKPACIDIDRGSNRRVVGNNQLLIIDGYGRSALLTLSQPCSRVDELDMIGFETYSSSLCNKHDMKILHSRNGETPAKCLITDLKMMSRDETKAFEDQEGSAPKAS